MSNHIQTPGNSNNLCRFILALITCVLLFTGGVYAQGDPDEAAQVRTAQRTIYIYKFTDYIEWPNFKNFKEFKIGILGADETSLIAEFRKMSQTRKVREKPMVILPFNTLDEVKDIQILYVNKSSGFDIYEVLEKIKGKSILLVSENYAFHRSMINFIDADGNFEFELHVEKIEAANLTVSSALKTFSIESTADWYELYLKTEVSLEEEREKVEKQQQELSKQHDEIEQQQKKITGQNEKLSTQRAEITAQQAEMALQKEKLGEVLLDVEQQENILQEQINTLEKQEVEIAEQKKIQLIDMKLHLDRLNIQKAEIKKSEQQIEAQNSRLNQQLNQLETQQLVLYLFISMFVLIIISGFYIYRSYKIKQLANIELEEKNKAISEQKEQLEKSYDNVAVLAEIGQNITSTLDLETVLRTVRQSVGKLMDTSAFSIGVFNEEKQEITYMLFTERGKEMDVPPIPMTNKNSLAIWCATHEKEIFIRDAEKEFFDYVEEIFLPKGEMPKSVIYLPLMHEGKLIGVITAQSFTKNAYTKYHLEMLRTLATYTALALNNAEVYKDLNTAHKQVEEKNKDIMDSIRYAQRIQEAILPKRERILEYLPNMFIYYAPRDIVSGDFFWFEHIERVGVSIIVAADCTGHGVPAALITMIGYELLNQILRDRSIKDPGAALFALDQGIKTALNQTGASEEYESMDLALCTYHHKKKLLRYAGAHRPLYLIRDGELTEYNGDRLSVGGFTENEKVFTCHEIQLKKNDVFYLFSDGLPDQFGGPRGKKFMKKRFKETLLSIQDLTMAEQETYLKETIEKWRGEIDQVDDIVVIGIKV